MLAECGEVGTVNGCCDTPAHEIRLSESMYLDQKISTLAHELGHSLGLAHGTGVTLMNPGRGRDARHSPCVDQAALDAFASEYGAATLPVVCYGDDVRQEALARYEDLAHPERQ
jgi:hypothetical protein